jgi:hypothetical protein
MRWAFLLATGFFASIACGDEEPKSFLGKPVGSSPLTVCIAGDGRSIHAFSESTGRWSHLELKTKLPGDAAPVIAGEMAAIQTKDKIYAIGSGMKGWAALTLKNPQAEVTVGRSIKVQDGRLLFCIGADSDRWEGIDLDTGSVALPESDG